MKLAILSCFHPYRGGIAQFNDNLFLELSKQHDIKAFNFKRQYPDFLFPGKTQYVSAEDIAVSIKSKALLDTANPFNWSKSAKEIRKWNPDVLILRYWMSYFAPSLGFVARKMSPNCKVVAILDNVIPHEQHFFDTAFTRFFLKSIDGCITLCNEVASDLFKIEKDIAQRTLFHPEYSHFGDAISQAEGLSRLGLNRDKKTLLFFGLIREYKGLDILLEAFDLLDDSYQILIAGEPYGSFEKYNKIIDNSKGRDRIHLFLDYIPDSKVKDFFCASDLVVLPYRSATQSGISNIANHFLVPMIVTDVGGLKETIGERGTGLVCEQCDPSSVAEKIKLYFSNPSIGEGLKENIVKENEKISWSQFAKELTEFAASL